MFSISDEGSSELTKLRKFLVYIYYNEKCAIDHELIMRFHFLFDFVDLMKSLYKDTSLTRDKNNSDTDDRAYQFSYVLFIEINTYLIHSFRYYWHIIICHCCCIVYSYRMIKDKI